MTNQTATTQNDYVPYFRNLTGATEESLAAERAYDVKAYVHVKKQGKLCDDNCLLCGTYVDRMRDEEGR